MASDLEMDDETMQVLTPPQGHVLAVHSCVWCKRTKKKCDRILPGCSQCIGKARECTYSEDGRDFATTMSTRPAQRLKTSHSGSSPAPPQRTIVVSSHSHRPQPVASALSTPQPSSSEHRLRRLEFPAAVFLDWELFKQCQLDIPKATVPIPSYVSDRIGDNVNVDSIANQFFDSIHVWMPIISRKRFNEQLANLTTHDHADFALLVLCMKLIVSVPPADVRDAQTTLYLCAKRYFLECENTGVLSIKTLQSQLLITLYEIGHAIYPAAFMSLGSCVRQGQALGIHWDENGKEAKTALTRAMSWVQLEEQHRVWWAVVILDRYMSMGCPQRPLSTRNPGEEVMYPANDAAWDEGVVPSRRIYGNTAAMAYELDGFAVLARSAALLGKVLLEHVIIDPRSKTALDEAMLLSRTLRGLVADELGSGVPLHQQTALCSSALLLLHDLYRSRPMGAPLLESLKLDYSAIMSSMALRSSEEEDQTQCPPGETCEDGMCSKHISPLSITSLYSAIVATVRMLSEVGAKEEEKKGTKENGNGNSEKIEKANLGEKVTRLKAKMENMRSRWTLGNTYLELLEAREIASYR